MTERPSAFSPKVDKSNLLSASMHYTQARLESVGRRASNTMIFLGSFLAFATSPLFHGEPATAEAKWRFALSHPSVLVGLLGLVVLLWSEIARVRRAEDMFSRIVFSDADLAPLRLRFVEAPIDDLLPEMIDMLRIAGTFLRRRIMFYNVGCVLFAVSVALFVVGL
jgi:hypothetical protein